MKNYLKKHMLFLEGFSYAHGIPFITGLPFESNYEKAYSKFTQSILDGDILGYYGIALISQFSSKEIIDFSYKKALNQILSYQDTNDPIYNLILAQCYEFGDGVKKDVKKSLDFYTKTINLGCVFGNYFLGEAYWGDNFKKDIKKAEKEYNTCIKNDFSPAYYKLGLIYSNEYKDYVNAKKYILKSIEHGRIESVVSYIKLLVGDGVPKPTQNELKIGQDYISDYIKSNPGNLYAQFIYAVLLIKSDHNDISKTIQGHLLLKTLADNGFEDAVKFYRVIKEYTDELIDTLDELQERFSELGINMPNNNLTEQKMNDILSEVSNVFNDFDGYKFEDMCSRIFKNMGYQITNTPYSGDGGIDLILTTENKLIKQKIIVQCKYWSHSIGAPVIRDLYGTLMDNDADKAILITNNTFTEQAIHFAKNKPLQLIDGIKLRELQKKYLFIDIKNES